MDKRSLAVIGIAIAMLFSATGVSAALTQN
jgi:hypothetical protein